MKPGVFSSGNITPIILQARAYRGQFTTVIKPTAPSVSTFSGMRSATLQPRSTMQQKHLLPVEPFQGFLVSERDFPPKCSWKMLLLIQLNWVIAFLFTPSRHTAICDRLPKRDYFIFLPHTVFYSNACNDSFVHLSNTNARKN